MKYKKIWIMVTIFGLSFIVSLSNVLASAVFPTSTTERSTDTTENKSPIDYEAFYKDAREVPKEAILEESEEYKKQKAEFERKQKELEENSKIIQKVDPKLAKQKKAPVKPLNSDAINVLEFSTSDNTPREIPKDKHNINEATGIRVVPTQAEIDEFNKLYGNKEVKKDNTEKVQAKNTTKPEIRKTELKKKSIFKRFFELFS